MNIERCIDNRIGVITSDQNPAGSETDIRLLINAGFTVLVTVDNYDFNLSWGAGDDVIIRHYQCTFGEYPHATPWELQHLNEYFLYEIAHGRNIAIWCRDDGVQCSIKTAVELFFRFDDTSLSDLISQKLETQVERAKRIPATLIHCKACLDRKCITSLVCHVSSIDDAKEILRGGKILSASNARRKSGEYLAKDVRNAAGDPPDYFDYVMFTFGNCTAGDNLVMERMLGRSPTTEELKEKFMPGVRFYFRYSDMVKHPGFRSDGYHFCKIQDSIELKKYVQAIVAPEFARDNLLRAIASELKDKIHFINEAAFPDLFTWSHHSYEEAVIYP